MTTPYNQTFSAASSSISITTPTYSVLLFVDANSNTVYLTADSTESSFDITASVNVYRSHVELSNLGVWHAS